MSDQRRQDLAGEFQRQRFEQCAYSALRASLRDFPKKNFQTSIDISADHLFSQARVLIAAIVFFQSPNLLSQQALERAKKSSKSFPFYIHDDQHLIAECLLRRSSEIAWNIVESVAASFGTALSSQASFTARTYAELVDAPTQHFEGERLIQESTMYDLATKQTQFFEHPLWCGANDPLKEIRSHPGFMEFFNAKYFSFWRQWYDGILQGKPLSLELQERVSQIPDEFWEDGPRAVAQEIDRLRADFDTPTPISETRFPQYEPQSTSHIWENQHLFTMSSGGVSAAISRDMDALHAEGINQFPEHFEPMKTISVSTYRISEVLGAANRNEEGDKALREEIGRLTALVVKQAEEIGRLKAELSAALEANDEGVLRSLKAGAKTFLLGGGLPATLTLLVALGTTDKSLSDIADNLASKGNEVVEMFGFERSAPSNIVVENPIEI